MEWIRSFISVDKKVEFAEAVRLGTVAEILNKLDESVANALVEPSRNETVLHVAVEKDYSSVVEALLAKGADPNAQDSEGTTPLHLAAGQDSVEIASMLIASGAQIDAKNAFGSTALHIAAFQGQHDTVDLLVKAGASVDAQENDERTALHGAALKNELTICQTLVKASAQVDLKEKDGKTALHTAVYNGHLQIVRFLIGAGADVNSQTNDGDTPLHRAVMSTNPDTVDIISALLEHNAATDKQNKDKRIPLQLAFLASLDLTAQDEGGSATLTSKIRLLIEKTEISSMFIGVGVPEAKSKEYQKLLEDNDIDPMLYRDVDEQRLEAFGITSHGHRMKVSKCLQFVGQYTNKI